MPQSLVKILVHIVFSTKNRTNLILPEKEKDLYAYISGIVEGNKAKLIIANGTMNHSHFLVSLGRNNFSELIGDMKRGSSGWGKKNGISPLILKTLTLFHRCNIVLFTGHGKAG